MNGRYFEENNINLLIESSIHAAKNRLCRSLDIEKTSGSNFITKSKTKIWNIRCINNAIEELRRVPFSGSKSWSVIKRSRTQK